MACSSYKDLREHVGHNIACVMYGDEDNVAVECADCGTILLKYNQGPYVIKCEDGRYYAYSDVGDQSTDIICWTPLIQKAQSYRREDEALQIARAIEVVFGIKAEVEEITDESIQAD